MVIRSDKNLTDCFNRILAGDAEVQRVRVSLLRDELTKLSTPSQIMKFVLLLGNDRLAEQVHKAINR